MLSTFILLNALYSKFKRLKILGKTSCDKIGGARLEGSPSIGSSKILNFELLELDESTFRNW